MLQAGANEICWGERNVQHLLELTDDVTLGLGAHRLTLGAHAERVRISLGEASVVPMDAWWQFDNLDALAAESAHEWSVHWHVAPELAVRERATNAVLITDPSRADGHLLEVAVIGDGSLRAGTSWCSTAYGARCESAHLAYASAGTGRQHAITLLVPAPAQVRARPDERGVHMTDITIGQSQDRIVGRGTAPMIELAGLATDAECAVLTNADRENERVYLLGASFVEGDGLTRERVAPGALWSGRRAVGRWSAQPITDRSRE
jgi:hypothetical protein